MDHPFNACECSGQIRGCEIINFDDFKLLAIFPEGVFEEVDLVSPGGTKSALLLILTEDLASIGALLTLVLGIQLRAAHTQSGTR
jgi:hypothetical protein